MYVQLKRLFVSGIKSVNLFWIKLGAKYTKFKSINIHCLSSPPTIADQSTSAAQYEHS